MAALRTRSRRSRCGRGSALVTALLTAMVLTILGTSVLAMSAGALRLSVIRRDGEMAFNVAEAGVRHGVRRLKENKTYAGQAALPFGAGTVTIRMVPVAGEPKQQDVIATATLVSVGGREVQRTIKSRVDFNAPSGAFNHAILSDEALDLNGNPQVDSGPRLNEGHIHSNARIFMSGNPDIYGRASAVGTVSWSGNPRIVGGAVSGEESVDLPPVDDEALRLEASRNGVTAGEVHISSNDPVTLSGLYTGNLKISGNPAITMVGIVYVRGTIELSGNTTTRIGDGVLVTEGGLKFNGNGTFEGGNGMALVSLSRAARGASVPAVDISGNPTIKGVIYSPYGHFKLSGNPTILGSIVTRSIEISGNPTVTRNTDFDQPEVLRTIIAVRYWQEM